MWVSRKKENFCREKRVAHRNQECISWYDASHSFWSASRNLWQSLSESIVVFIKSLVLLKQSLSKMRRLRSIKKWALKRVRSFLIFYVAWNSNEELARYFRNALVLPESPAKSTKALKVFITAIFKHENSMRTSETIPCFFSFLVFFPSVLSQQQEHIAARLYCPRFNLEKINSYELKVH